MSEASFPGPGPDGGQPPPGGPARDEAAGMPAGVPEDDWDGDAEMAAYIADLEAGRARIPEEWEVEGPAATGTDPDLVRAHPNEQTSICTRSDVLGELLSPSHRMDAL